LVVRAPFEGFASDDCWCVYHYLVLRGVDVRFSVHQIELLWCHPSCCPLSPSGFAQGEEIHSSRFVSVTSTQGDNQGFAQVCVRVSPHRVSTPLQIHFPLRFRLLPRQFHFTTVSVLPGFGFCSRIRSIGPASTAGSAPTSIFTVATACVSCADVCRPHLSRFGFSLTRRSSGNFIILVSSLPLSVTSVLISTALGHGGGQGPTPEVGDGYSDSSREPLHHLI
jgi:hypothetical protein